MIVKRNAFSMPSCLRHPVRAAALLIFLTTALFSFNLCEAKTIKQQEPSSLKNPPAENKKVYRVQFFPLKRGHSLAPSILMLHDQGKLELQIEHEELLSAKGTYSMDNFRFTANWQFSIKKTKCYHYVLQFNGFYFFDTYIVGGLTLKEYVEETKLTQEIPFVFLATVENEEGGRQQ